MEKFAVWLEAIDSVHLGKTEPYVSSPGAALASTAGNQGDITQSLGASGASGVDPVVSQHVVSLQQTHDRLKQMFADIRRRASAFRTVGTRQSFEREMLAGIDGIGRSHALLAPSGGH